MSLPHPSGRAGVSPVDVLYTCRMAEVSGRQRTLRYLRAIVLPDPAVQGTFINEQQVATEVGVSRTPVREGLLILASEGLVQLIPRRGAYVPPLSAREITELFELRGVLERHGASALLAGGRPFHEPAERTPQEPGPRASELRSLLDEQRRMAEAPTRHTAAEFIELDSRFHQSVVDAAGNRLLSRTYAGLRERQLRLGIVAMSSRSSRWQEVCVEHAAITDALADGDERAAHTAIDDHLRITLQTLLVL